MVGARPKPTTIVEATSKTFRCLRMSFPFLLDVWFPIRPPFEVVNSPIFRQRAGFGNRGNRTTLGWFGRGKALHRVGHWRASAVGAVRGRRAGAAGHPAHAQAESAHHGARQES